MPHNPPHGDPDDTHTYTCTHTHTRVHTHIHTHTHTYTCPHTHTVPCHGLETVSGCYFWFKVQILSLDQHLFRSRHGNRLLSALPVTRPLTPTYILLLLWVRGSNHTHTHSHTHTSQRSQCDYT